MNNQIQFAITNAINRAIKKLADNMANSGKVIANAMTKDIKRHIQAKYPRSRHWDTNKVTSSNTNNTGTTSINIPGAARAYHDITIKPKYAKHLAIPLHKMAYGISPKQLDLNLTVRNNKMFLVDKNLTFMYVLKDKVHQKKDSSLLPSDEMLANSIMTEVLKQSLKNVSNNNEQN